MASARTNFQAVLKKLSEGTVDKYYVAQSSVTTLAAPKKRAAKPKATKATATDGNDNAENGTTSKKRVRKAKLPDTGNNGDLHAVKSESEAPDAKRVKPDPELAVKKEEEPSDMSNDAA